MTSLLFTNDNCYAGGVIWASQKKMKSNHGFTWLLGCLIFLLVANFSAYGYNGTSPSPNTTVIGHDIDFELLKMFGVNHELAEQFRVNLLKAIESEKDEIPPLRQGNQGEIESEEEESSRRASTPGVNAFGVLTGIFGIFSGFGTFNPTRVLQSTINFFPPGTRPQAQMVVDALSGYFTPRNRTSPTPRMRVPIRTNLSSTVISKDSEKMTGGDANEMKGVTTEESQISEEVMSPPPPPEPTTTEGFLNVHEIIRKSSTPAPKPEEQDDENDFEKGMQLNRTNLPKSNSSLGIYKVKGKSPPEK